MPDAHAQKATVTQRLDLKRLALAVRDAKKPSAPIDAMLKLKLSLPYLAANRMGGTAAEDTIAGVTGKLSTGVVF